MLKILEMLKEKAWKEFNNLPPEAYILRGLWRTEYILKLTNESTTFHLRYILAQTLSQGCSYYELEEEEPMLKPSFIGDNVLDLDTKYKCITIATLDALFGSLKKPPTYSHIIEGTNFEKDYKRAKIICDEAFSILKKKSLKNGHKAKVVNVGVVGNILAILKDFNNIQVNASDFYKGVVNAIIYGIKIDHGSKTLDLIAKADLAIVTGMSLANDTLDGILDIAHESNTSLVLFAETGANFAQEYCNMGIDSVVSEPFPFYLSCPGNTTINVYRRIFRNHNYNP